MSHNMYLKEVEIIIVNLQIISKVIRKIIDYTLRKLYFDMRKKNIISFLIIVITHQEIQLNAK